MIKMPQQFSRRLLLAATPALLAGCGTMLYPERRGQPKGRLDWGVVALNGVGLLLFFVPGVIAFAVDFATGAIYLPCYPHTATGTAETELRKVSLPPEKMNQEGIEATISQHTKKEIDLSQDSYQTESLQEIKAFWPTYQSLQNELG